MLIYCGGGNRRFYEIATAYGFEYGSQLPETVYGPLYFADQDWKKPNRSAYMTALKMHRPHMATVLDLEHEAQLHEVLSWAEEAAQYVSVVCIIPKAVGIISSLPQNIGGAEVRLAYSVPTRYGGTHVPAWEFDRRPVHLLGGQPHVQLRLAHYFRVASVDGNYANKMATRFCQFWMPGNARGASNRHWPTLREADGELWNGDAPYEAFRRSCENISAAWKRQRA